MPECTRRAKIFIGGACLGGCDDLLAIEEQGNLEKARAPGAGAIGRQGLRQHRHGSGVEREVLPDSALRGSACLALTVQPTRRREAEWREQLNPRAYRVVRQ